MLRPAPLFWDVGGKSVEETGEPGQKKQDARPRCPPLRFEEGVVGWKMGAGGRGWELAEGTAFTPEGVGGPWAPASEALWVPARVWETGLCPSLASETLLAWRLASRPQA